LIAYAARTGTIRNLAALRVAGWRLMLSAASKKLDPVGFRYALDNGAWSAFTAGEPFDVALFERAVERRGAGADFIVLPDIVAGGLASLDFSLSWIPRLRGVAPLYLAVQDGIPARLIRPVRPHVAGIFLGGSTEWKLDNAIAMGELSRELGLDLHVARVNTVRRIFLAIAAGAASFDGSSVSRYVANLPRLDSARKQRALL
jgi:hypothetical protein